MLSHNSNDISNSEPFGPTPTTRAPFSSGGVPGLLLVDENNIIRMWNTRLESLVDISASRAVGQDLAEVWLELNDILAGEKLPVVQELELTPQQKSETSSPCLPTVHRFRLQVLPLDSGTVTGKLIQVSPVETLESSPAPSSSTDPLDLRGLPVLVVGEDAFWRSSISRALRGLECRPHAVCGMAEAHSVANAAKNQGTPFRVQLLKPGHQCKFEGKQDFPTLLIEVPRKFVRESLADGYLVCPASVDLDSLAQALLRALAASPGDRPKVFLPTELPQECKARILVADDSPVTRVALTQLLEQHGYEAHALNSGHQAILAAQSSYFDLLLLNASMPRSSGLVVAREIHRKRSAKTQRLRMIGLCGRESPGLKDRCLEAGMNAAVDKPVHHEELLALIGGLLASAQPPANDVSPEDHPVLDHKALLKRVGGRQALMQQLICSFFQQEQDLLEQVRSAVREASPQALERSCHKLSGILGNLSAQAAWARCREMETLARRGSTWGAEAFLQNLERELDRLDLALGRMAQETKAA